MLDKVQISSGFVSGRLWTKTNSTRSDELLGYNNVRGGGLALEYNNIKNSYILVWHTYCPSWPPYLPTTSCFPVIRKIITNPLVDFAKCHFLALRTVDRKRYEIGVGIRWLALSHLMFPCFVFAKRSVRIHWRARTFPHWDPIFLKIITTVSVGHCTANGQLWQPIHGCKTTVKLRHIWVMASLISARLPTLNYAGGTRVNILLWILMRREFAYIAGKKFVSWIWKICTRFFLNQKRIAALKMKSSPSSLSRCLCS